MVVQIYPFLRGLLGWHPPGKAPESGQALELGKRDLLTVGPDSHCLLWLCFFLSFFVIVNGVATATSVTRRGKRVSPPLLQHSVSPDLGEGELARFPCSSLPTGL